jgi:hypothetical protein
VKPAKQLVRLQLLAASIDAPPRPRGLRGALFSMPRYARLGQRRSSLQGPCAELDLEMQILAAGISQLTA